jgi:hypothetical protein
VPSYSPVFSQGFIYLTASTPNTSFLVPEGYTAVIRQATATTVAGAAVIYFQLQNSGIAPLITWAIATITGALENWQWQGRVVVPGGGYIQVDDNYLGTQDQVYVGGYLLRDNLT